MKRAERRARAMGSAVQVVVWAAAHADRLAELGMLRIDLLESCWTRFRPESELSRLNARAGSGPLPASADLLTLVQTMVDAYEWTDGAVDASVLDAMCAAGYDVDFAEVRRRASVNDWPDGSTVLAARPAHGMAGLEVDHQAGTVLLPAGRRLDPGAVGKGLAGEIVAEELRSAGAAAVLVSIGGDVVAHGTPPTGAWRVSVQDDRRSVPTSLEVIELRSPRCAVATSSVLRRRWIHGHHLLDPRTGSPSHSDVVQATVVASLGWQAEAAATFAVLRGSATAVRWLGDRSLDAFLLPLDPDRPSWLVGWPTVA